MHIDYEISEQDYLRAQRLAFKKSGQVPWTTKAIPWFGFFLLGLIGYYAVTQGVSWNFLPGAAFALFMVSAPVLTKGTIRKVYLKSPNLHGALSLDLDDDGVHFRGATFDSRVKWEYFLSFFEDQDSFVMFTSARVFNIIPKRNLTPEQLVGVRDQLSSHIKKHA